MYVGERDVGLGAYVVGRPEVAVSFRIGGTPLDENEADEDGDPPPAVTETTSLNAPAVICDGSEMAGTDRR